MIEASGAIDKKSLALPLILIIVLGFAIYANVINGKFIWDDNLLVRDNIYIRNWPGIANIFFRDLGSGSAEKYGYYRPLQIFSYMLEYACWGLNPAGYHITNIVLHILVGLSLFWLVIILYGDKLFAFLAGIVFISHPLQTEAVAYISDRGDLLCALFFLLSFILYIKYTRCKNGLIYLVMAISYSLCLLSKENAVVFIAVLLLYHYAFKEKLTFKHLLPIIAITITYAVLRSVIIEGRMPEFKSIFDALPGFFTAFITYLRLLFFPYGLHFAYGNKVFRFTDAEAVAGAVIILLLIIYALIRREKGRVIFFSVSWFLAALIPATGLYPATAFYMAEHYLYIPSIGFALILANSLVWLCAKRKFRACAIFMAAAIVIFYGYSTVRQNNYWREPIGFYLKTLRFSPDTAEVHYNLGTEYDKINNEPKAIALYKRAIELDPYYDSAYNNLGVIYSRLNNKEEALRLFKKAIELNPRSANTYNNLGILYYAINKKNESINSFKKALGIIPNYPDTLYNLAVLYYYEKQYGLALKYCDMAVKFGYTGRPDFLKLLEPHRKQHF